MADSKIPSTDDITEILGRFTNLNNELLDTKRELVKRNLELDRLQRELQEKNTALTSLNAELEKRVLERTKQLSLALNEIDDFAYSLSHDLRTPLRGIDGYSAVMMEDYADKLDEQAIKHLTSIRRDAQRLGEVLDALHGLSNVSRKELSLSKVNLSEMGERVIQKLIIAYPERKVEFSIQQGLSEYCDRELMKSVLNHLFSNAIKFSKREATARIEFGMEAKDGVKTYFVKDNGVGFNMEFVNKLFHNFQRLHRYNDFEGIGIGLATVRRVIIKHGGSIWAESEPGKGAVFYFTLEHSP